MIFKITSESNEYYDSILKESMDDLNRFYGINWVHHLPKIVIVQNRAQIDQLRSEKTEPWLVGWAEEKMVYVLDKDNFEKESEHQFTHESYKSLIKHEISHAFFGIVSNKNYRPIWLCEGVAIYTSGQNSEKEQPEKFETFLEFYEDGSGVYAESGFAVELLVKKFGKEKLLELVRNLKSASDKDSFTKLFGTIYGFIPSYEKFNEMRESVVLKVVPESKEVEQ